MGRNWKTTARYLQNAANTLFAQCSKEKVLGFEFDEEVERRLAREPEYPQQLWMRVRSKILTYITIGDAYGNEALGRIIGAGHPDNSGEGWIYVEDILPVLHVRADVILIELAAATLVAAKVNFMRGKRP